MLTISECSVILNEQVTERYRSGHNEAVLKTVCPQGHVGSNPTLSAYDISHNIIGYQLTVLSQNYLGEVPKWLKGHPWKGCRSLIAARGFKSLLLRSTVDVNRWKIYVSILITCKMLK